MIKSIEAKIKIEGEEKTFGGDDIDKLIADIDSYLVSKKSK
jgi:hypothetical protein